MTMSAVAHEEFETQEPSVTYEPGVGLVAYGLLADDPQVLQEASRWSTGQRGAPVALDELDGADLAPFTKAALGMGALVLATTADSSGVAVLSGTVTQLADRAEAATASLVADTTRASSEVVNATVEAAKKITVEATAAIDEARKRLEAELNAMVDRGTNSVATQLDALLGVASPVAATINDIVKETLANAHVGWHAMLTQTLSEVTTSLDTDSPGSPLNVLERRLREQQSEQHRQLTDRLDRMQDAVSAATNAAVTAAAVAAAEAASPAKGKPFEAAVGAVVERIAVGIGAAYGDTSDSVGAIRNCKKGDGLIEVSFPHPGGEPARIALEYTTTAAKRNWNSYLEEAEKNRAAQASLGVVPTSEFVPGGELVALLSDSRIVVAFDPDRDDEALLRAVVQLLAAQAVRRMCEGRSGDLGVVDTKLTQARHGLIAMQELVKTATAVRNGATKVVAGLEASLVSLGASLEQAHSALRDAYRGDDA